MLLHMCLLFQALISNSVVSHIVNNDNDLFLALRESSRSQCFPVCVDIKQTKKSAARKNRFSHCGVSILPPHASCATSKEASLKSAADSFLISCGKNSVAM